MIKKIGIAILIGMATTILLRFMGTEDWYRGYFCAWSSMFFLYIYDAVKEKYNRDQTVQECDATKSN